MGTRAARLTLSPNSIFSSVNFGVSLSNESAATTCATALPPSSLFASCAGAARSENPASFESATEVAIFTGSLRPGGRDLVGEVW